MFNHQYDFDIEIPSHLVSNKKHNSLFEDNINGKVILGLIGYAKSGKDTIANRFIKEYGFNRVAFADNIKVEMNSYLREIVYEYLFSVNNMSPNKKIDIEDGLLLEDLRSLTFDMIDFQTEDIFIKKRLRPFIIWYGEKMREINGPYYWINKAFEVDAKGCDNIIISDVRRVKELDVFRDSNSFRKRSELGFASAAYYENPTSYPIKNYSSLLFHVSQLGLQDSDVLTHECIRKAQEDWMLDHTFYIDPRLPEKGKYRNNSINLQVKEVSKKFGINKPDKTISAKQTKMF